MISGKQINILVNWKMSISNSALQNIDFNFGAKFNFVPDKK